MQCLVSMHVPWAVAGSGRREGCRWLWGGGGLGHTHLGQPLPNDAGLVPEPNVRHKEVDEAVDLPQQKKTGRK
jgi:hypothetical protein